ncbi:MAG: hypothetical protein AMJ65_06930 [Phycisphaerae bacterium SG8_4]|nr:MAG: hypothetical protein AMJ65_06930 [Phycisphaerae bacterium SG8_4]
MQIQAFRLEYPSWLLDASVAEYLPKQWGLRRMDRHRPHRDTNLILLKSCQVAGSIGSMLLTT